MERIQTTALDDEWVCFDRETGRMIVTNEVGLRMWRGLLEGQPRRRIAADIASRFDAVPEAVARDLDAFAAALDDAERRRIDALGGPGAPVLDPVPERVPIWAARARWRSAAGELVLESESSDVVEGLSRLLGTALEPLPLDAVIESDATALQVWCEGERFPFVHRGTTLDTGLDLADAVGRLARVGAGVLASLDGWIAALHAAVVERDGRAIVLPAASGTGKTTLAAWLVGRGAARLVNDEIAILRAGDMLHPPVAYPLSIKSGSVSLLASLWPALDNAPVRLDRLGRPVRELGVPPERMSDVPSRAIAIVQLNRVADEQATGGAVHDVSRATMLRALLDNRLSVSTVVDWHGIVALVDWLRDVPCLRLDYATLEEAERALESVWERFTPASEFS